MLAIDPDAPAGELFRAASLEEFADPEPFDAVVASLALHHVARPSGRARQDRVPLAAGRPAHRQRACRRPTRRADRALVPRETRGDRTDAPRSLEQCLHEWEEDHAGLHGYAAMRKELDRRFTERFFAGMPYLYGELAGAVTDLEERALIDAGAIQATGFRYVGERQLNETA